MFCGGEGGNTINLPQRYKKTKIPLNKIVSASVLMEREKEGNYILFCRNILNQFMVDMYAKIEKLNFIRNDQKKL